MLTQLTIRNFKVFDSVEIDLGDRVIFIGPNNSGKTTALQALALWDIGLKRWIEKRGTGEVPKKRPGVTVNRRDLISVPVPAAKLLWRNLRVRESSSNNGTKNLLIEIIVKGVSDGREWQCGLEFDYANEESFYCRPIRLVEGEPPERMPIPHQANVRLAFLPPMSGLAPKELRIDAGAINGLLGEGRSAEVLRNLCLRILCEKDGLPASPEGEERWKLLVSRIRKLFGVMLQPPVYSPVNGEITLTYKNKDGILLDISSSGRGLQQTLLLLTHMMANPGSVLLLDEPDAHLEILRQRQIYHLLVEIASENRNQLIAASHSEVILNEAGEQDAVVAFVGRPHRIDSRSQVLKSLRDIGFDHYYQAEETGWVLYLEGSTDLAILRAFAKILNHQAAESLERPFFVSVANQPKKAQDHFHGLREAKPGLVGFALYDRLERALPEDRYLRHHAWRRREIENYLASRETLLTWAKSTAEAKGPGPLFSQTWISTMDEVIESLTNAQLTLMRPSPWSSDIKVTDDFLDPLFSTFFKRLSLPNLMTKTNYHELARFVRPEALDAEVIHVLDAIVSTASAAKPRND